MAIVLSPNRLGIALLLFFAISVGAIVCAVWIQLHNPGDQEFAQLLAGSKEVAVTALTIGSQSRSETIGSVSHSMCCDGTE